MKFVKCIPDFEWDMTTCFFCSINQHVCCSVVHVLYTCIGCGRSYNDIRQET